MFLCPGVVKVDIVNVPAIDEIEQLNSVVIQGGRWHPPDCIAWQKVALIIPYRQRFDHLLQMIHRLHPLLRKQKVSYQIFVVEQVYLYV